MTARVQGFGGPCCARILTTWFATKERGTYWGMWNIAHNLGGFLAPIVAGTAARMYGWKYGACTREQAQPPLAHRPAIFLADVVCVLDALCPCWAWANLVLGAAALPVLMTRAI